MNEHLDALYKDVILDHHQEPRNFGTIEGADVFHEGYNPMCGDRVKLSLKLDGPTLTECQFHGEGCSICIASTSIMTEEVNGKSLEEVRALIHGVRELLQGRGSVDSLPEEVGAISGVKRFPVRIKCALLGWTTLGEALEISQKGRSV